MEDRPNIVCLVLDSARADTLSCYGGPADTPNIDAIGDDGILFRNAFSPASWTVPSHASLFTGVYPSEHGTDKGSRFLNPNYPTLAEQLRDVGYTTVLFTNNVHLTSEFGFDRGFDITASGHGVSADDDTIDWNEFLKHREHDSGLGKVLEILRHLWDHREKNLVQSLRQAVALKYHHHYGDNGARSTVDFFEGRTFEEPYFIFINLMEPHNPFRPPSSYTDETPPDVTGWKYEAEMESLTDDQLQSLRWLYQRELEYVDARVGELRTLLDGENTVFTVTSDHGVAIGEHGLLYHGDGLYNCVTKIPLLISGPTDSRTVERPTSLLSLYRTYLKLAGLTPPDYTRGVHVLKDEDKREDESVYMELQGQSDEILDAIREAKGAEVATACDKHQRAIVSGRYKYIYDIDENASELYDYWEDPREESPLDDPERAEEMAVRLDAIVDSLSPREYEGEITNLETDVEDQLKQLGYIT